MAAFTINSEERLTHSDLSSLYQFLTDFRNFGEILPADKVEGFAATDDHCSFTIKGITPLTVRIRDKREAEFISFQSEGLSKFNFVLDVSFSGDARLPGACKIELHGDLNPFIKTMAEKPLTALVNQMSDRLANLKLN